MTHAIYVTSKWCNYNGMSKIANLWVPWSDFLVWSRGGNTRMGLFGVSFRLDPNRSFLSLSDNRQLYRVSIGWLVPLRCRFNPPYLCRRETPNSSLAMYWPRYWRSSFSFALCRHPFCFSRFEIDVVSRVTLPAWPRQGYGCHWLFFRALSPVCILSVVGCSIVSKVIWIFV